MSFRKPEDQKKLIVRDTDDHSQRDHGDADNLPDRDGLVKNQRGPDKEKDIAEAAAQIGRCQWNLLQNQLPADGIDAEDDDGKPEPEEIAERKGLISLGADFQAGRGKALHENGESGEEKDIAPLVEKMRIQKNTSVKDPGSDTLPGICSRTGDLQSDRGSAVRPGICSQLFPDRAGHCAVRRLDLNLQGVAHLLHIGFEFLAGLTRYDDSKTGSLVCCSLAIFKACVQL